MFSFLGSENYMPNSGVSIKSEIIAPHMVDERSYACQRKNSHLRLILNYAHIA